MEEGKVLEEVKVVEKVEEVKVVGEVELQRLFEQRTGSISELELHRSLRERSRLRKEVTTSPFG